VTVRPILPDELEKVAYVRATGYGGSEAESLASLQDNPRYNFSNIIVAEYQGEVVGTVAVFPAQMWLSGVPISIGAVTGVAVLPQFSEKG